ncbi:MAG: PH domain-containing protein [Acidimicrobiales bacterium]
MPLRKRMLNDGEEVLVDLRPHWWFLAMPMIATAICSAFAILVLAGAVARSTAMEVAAVVLVVVSALWLLLRYASWASTSLVLTTSRLVLRTGVLTRYGRDIPLERIADVSYRQSLFGRMIGSGELVAIAAGGGAQLSYGHVPRPMAVQSAVQQQLDRLRRSAAASGQQASSLSVPEQIEKLYELRQRGAISQDEFERVKAGLVGEMHAR